MNNLLLAGLLLLGWARASAQPNASAPTKYSTRAGTITFFSATPIEDISARNEAVVAALDLSSAAVAFMVPMTQFRFKNGLMQTHFNENYVESGKYPTATFSGLLLNFAPAALQAGGAAVPVQVDGVLTIHNVKRRVRAPGTLALLPDGRLQVQSKFVVAPADYNIEIPLLVRGHIAKSVDVAVNLLCDAVLNP